MGQFLKGGYIRDYMGDYCRDYYGGTRSLHNYSCELRSKFGLGGPKGYYIEFWGDKLRVILQT